MASKKQIDANRRNAKRSSGPKSASGKAVVASNALREGVFSPQLYIADEDRPLYNILSAELLAQYQPKTPMQFVAFEGILCSAWRYALALRREARKFRECLGADERADSITPPKPVSRDQWFASNGNSLRAAESLLKSAREQLEESGGIDCLLKESLDKTFGNEFLGMLDEWPATKLFALQLAQHSIDMQERWGVARPSPDPSVKVVKDPMERVHMQIKLIDQKLQHLTELRYILEATDDLRARTSAMHAEPSHRYATAAYRSLMAATQFYLNVLESGL
jgi:hypothetical protein